MGGCMCRGLINSSELMTLAIQAGCLPHPNLFGVEVTVLVIRPLSKGQ